MMRLAVALVLLLLPGSATSPAQSRPDFTGTWTLDEERSQTPTHEGFVGPVIWAIQQSPTSLVVTINRGPKQFKLTYTLSDRAPSATSDVPSYRGFWDGDKLVTETTLNIQGQTVTTRETRSLQQDGREMLVERVVEVEHGYTLRGGQNYNMARDVFTRTAP